MQAPPRTKLHPPDRIGSQRPMRGDPSGSIPTQTLSLKIPLATCSGDLVIGRVAVAATIGDHVANPPRPVPRLRSCSGTCLPTRLGEQSLASGDGATRWMSFVRPLKR
jgi:hypothetical protein